MIDYTIETQSLAERTADKVETLIKEKKLLPGEKIPNEYDLANKLSVGRSTVREAIKLLVSKNVLEIRRGSGTFVCDNTGFVDDPLGLRFEEDQRRIALDLARIRLLIEPQMAYEAARLSTAKDVEELLQINNMLDQLIAAKENYGEVDAQLHTKICSISGNLIMPKLMPVITSSVTYYTKLSNAQHAKISSDAHKKIILAIQNHDSQLAHNLMYEHINIIFSTL